MTPSDELDDFIDENTVIWLGAGVAADQDYPSWPQLIRELCDRCGVAYPGSQVAPPSAEALMDAADACKTADPTSYQQHLVDRFGPQATPNTKRDLYLDLVKLNVRAYVTTNFDHLLSIAARGAHRDFKELLYPGLFAKHLTDRSRSPIYYLHGRAEENSGAYNDLVLSKTEFERAYREPGHVRTVVETLLREWPILFIGVGRGLTQDEYLRELVESARTVHDDLGIAGYGEPPKRLALISMKTGLDADEQAEENARVEGVEANLAQLGIDVLRVDVPVRAQRPWNKGGGQAQADYGTVDRVISSVADQRGLYREVPRVIDYGLGGESP